MSEPSADEPEPEDVPSDDPEATDAEHDVAAVPKSGWITLDPGWTLDVPNIAPAQTLEDLGIEAKKVEIERQRSDLNLGRRYAMVLLGALAIQIAIADGAFYVYGFYNHWDVPVSAIQVWLAATVIEVIGVVAVITRSLFPNNNKKTG